MHLQCSQCSSISGRLPCLPTESSEHQGAHCVTLASPWMPEWHASSGGEGGGGGGRGDGGGDGGDTHTAQAWHLHLVAKRRESTCRRYFRDPLRAPFECGRQPKAKA